MTFDEMRFKQVVMKSLKIDDGKYRPDLRLGDLSEWDSVAHLDLIMAIEGAFAIRFRSDELTELTSLDQLRSRLAAVEGG